MRMKYFEKEEDEMEIDSDYIPTKEERTIAKFIVETSGNVSLTAKSCNMSRVAVYRRLKLSPYLRSVLDDCRESLLDLAETKLGEAIERGEAWAVCFYLKTQGKSRGYIEKGELQVEAKFMTVADLVRRAHEQELEEKKRLGMNDWDDLVIDTDKEE